MNRYEVYEKYVAISNHFKIASYDYFKYSGKVNVSQASFEKRRDKYFFEKMSLKVPSGSILGFLVANCLANHGKYWINDLPKALDTYTAWQRKIESLFYNFQQECKKLVDNCEVTSFNDLFLIKDNEHPCLFKLLVNEEVSIETVIIFDKLVGFKKDWDAALIDPVWQEYSMVIKKYTPFLSIEDPDKYKKCLIDTFTNK